MSSDDPIAKMKETRAALDRACLHFDAAAITGAVQDLARGLSTLTGVLQGTFDDLISEEERKAVARKAPGPRGGGW